MIAELTFYRCYWPMVYQYLKDTQNHNYKSEAFGILATIDIEPRLAKQIMMRLPVGAVSDYKEVI